MIIGTKDFNEIAWIDTDEDWGFDTVIVLKDPETGKHFAGHDSGCSCPSPFDGMTDDLGDWVEVHSKNEVIDFAKRNLEKFNADDTIDLMSQLNNNW